MELTLVSYIQAQKLKEFGFPFNTDKECYYSKKLYKTYNEIFTDFPVFNIKQVFPAPSLALVIKWLEETKNIRIFTVPEYDKNTGEFNGYTIRIVLSSNTSGFSGFYHKGLKTRDEAESLGIDKAIELLKN